MKNDHRDLLVLLRIPIRKQSDFDRHIASLHSVLLHAENTETFCTSHELVTRLKITQRKRAILKAVAAQELKPFHFLINKN